MGTYTTVARSRANAVFYPGKTLTVSCPTPLGPLRHTFRTNYRPGFDAPLPTDFYVESVGEAATIFEAESQFLGAAMEVANIIAFVANADLGELELELAFGCTPGTKENEFMQRFVPLPPIVSVPSRPIEPDHVVSFLNLTNKHSEKERIQRAVAQYVEALRRWNSGHEIMCLAHLYMGVEALTKSLLRAENIKRGLNDHELAAAWNINVKKLDSEIRLRLIFDGDKKCFTDARAVSDGLEHGFEKFATMHQPARETVNRTAGYLRAAIIRLLDSTGVSEKTLMNPAWAEPRGPIKLSKKIRGKLVGAAEKLAMEDNPYPIFEWNSSLKRVQFGVDGRYGFAPEEKLTAQFGENVTLQMGSIEVWDDIIMSGKVSLPTYSAEAIELIVTKK